MIQTLREFYGLQPTPPGDLFQFVVWEVLSEHALPARRDLAWQALKRIPALTPDAMFRVPVKELSEVVGITGAHRDEKVERIRATVGEFKRHRELLNVERLRRGSVLAATRALRRLSSVSQDVQARVHVFVLHRPVLPVDADMHRVVTRLRGGVDDTRRRASRQWLRAQLANDGARPGEAVVYLRHHAQHTCVKVAPHCAVCPLRAGCGFAQD